MSADATAPLSNSESLTPAAVYNAESGRSFGRAAALFDSDEAANPLARWARRRSFAALDAAFGPGALVLEMGSGTGIEATHLAARGVRIVATDPATGMLEQLRAKLAPGGPAAHLADQITTIQLPANRIGELVDRYGPGAFDGAYSSMGALNCEPSLAPLAAALATLVRPGGRLVFSLINRYCLWETAWYLRARQPGMAFRRWGGSASATVRPDWQEERITCFYWTPGVVARTFQPHFRVVGRRALPWLLPPLYLDGLTRRAPSFFRRVARLDDRLAARWPLYALGDQFIFELVREPARSA